MNTQEKKIRKRVKKLIASEFNLTVKETEQVLFITENSMALTHHGHRILSSVYNYTQFYITETLLSKHILGLKQLNYPYYLTGKVLVLYSSEDATLAELYGSANDFLEAFSTEID